MRENIIKIKSCYATNNILILLIPLQIVLTVVFTLVFANIFLLFNRTINPFLLPISFLMSLFVTYFLFLKEIKNVDKKFFLKIFFLNSILTFLIFVGVILVSSQFHDTSYDSTRYHQEIILTLVDDKWNLIKDFDPPEGLFPGSKIWVTHYPKGAEILSASIYTITNIIESAKAYTILFIIASFGVVYYLSRNIFKINKYISLLISFIAAFNPISSYQSLSLYVDGQISSLIIIAIVFLILYVKKKSLLSFVSFLSVIIILCSIKLTSILYAVILCITLLLYFITNKEDFSSVLKHLLILLVTGIIGVFMINFNPYISNFIQKGNPVYPVIGKDSIDVMKNQLPQGHEELNSIEKFFSSHFWLSSENGKIILRPPFRLSEGYYSYFNAVDFRKGGFGPFYMEISIITFILSIFILFNKKIPKTDKLLFGFSVGMLLTSVVIIPMSWWARFVPQLYFINIIPLFVLFKNNKTGNFLGELLLLFLVLNSLYVTTFHLNKWFIHTKSINASIEKLQKEERAIFIFRNDKFHNNYKRLSENAIPYTIIDDPNEWEKLSNKETVFLLSPFEVAFVD
jgi:hypothetical protein